MTPFHRFSKGSAAAAAVTGAVVLAGWATGLEFFKNVIPGRAMMKPFTAVAFIVAGLALWRLAGLPSKKTAVAPLALLLLIIAGLFSPSRMSPLTLACFVLTGAALLLLGLELRHRLAQGLAAAAAVPALFIFVGHLYGVREIFGTTAMAVHTAATLLILEAGVLAARPDRGLMRILTAQTSEGRLVLWLLPPAVAIPVAAGWLRLLGERAGLYETEFGVTLSQFSTVLLMASLILFCARKLHHADLARRLSAEKTKTQALTQQSILNCLGEGVAVADEKGELTLFNPAAEKIVGMGPKKAAPKEWTGIYGTFFPDRKTPYPGEDQPLARAVRGESTDDVEIFLRNASIPEGVDVSVTGRPLVDGKGASLGGVVVFRDVTQKKKSEEELKALNKELEAFSYSVSHDLRAPLRHIGGFVELLNKKEAAGLSPEGRRYLGIVGEAAQKMGRLIDDLLHFSRVGRTELRREAVDLLKLAREVAGEMEKGEAQRKIAWEIGALPRVEGDPGLLRLVLVNLLSNALKYTGRQPAPRIELGTEGSKNGSAVLFVRDNGVGFDMKYADKLFGVFQRLHSESEFSGTGIGLANVRRIIHRHGGETWAESKVNQGACFYFSLPIAAEG